MTQSTSMAPPALHIRPARPDDAAFFAALYRSTRPDLLAMLADRRYIDGLVAAAWQAQAASYRERYPDARYQVLELDGEPVARLVTAAVARALRVVDLAVLPAARGRGVATAALQWLQRQARQDGRDLALAVHRDNAGARRLYAALGFAAEGEEGAVLALRWRP
ncbi:GNAT family N-acetyltransferase [Massilia sp. G4R7]|uniref:GNAT family N-acetyltransferase n=1 Tax=Massilia phyllostachyos TaxID=2898585 RepID=A0ABS8QBA5_9BURK|nr:GNAT family N-acetyltransferase [Massilia phyllostachyos]